MIILRHLVWRGLLEKGCHEMRKNAVRKIIRVAAALALAAAVLLCSGCQAGEWNFSTTILSEVDSPDTVLANFFDALQSREYERCGDYLADHETFLVTDNTGYGFVNTLTDYSMTYLKYWKQGTCEINNLDASRRIRVQALDMDKLSQCIKENFTPLEYEYLTEHNLRGIDGENDKEDVGNIMNTAIEQYVNTVGTVNHEVTVNFVFDDGGWKIKLDSALVAAIFGDESNG